MVCFQSYPTYKRTRAEWLGCIPAHWRGIQIKHLTPVKRGASPRPIDDPKYFDEDGEYAWVRIADVSASDRYLETTTQRLSELGHKLSVKMLPGNLFLSIAGTVGKPIIPKIKCCIHDGFVYFPDFKENKNFLYYIFACGQPYLGLGKMGTQLNLNTDTVGSIVIGLPPLLEQEVIVRFLDYKTGQIDALIAKKEALLTKLAEKRTALISHAVTKGLDPSAPMKDSGVKWMGEIPEHWRITRVKFVAKVGNGSTPSRENSEYWLDGTFPWLNSSVVNQESVFASDQFVSETALKECHLPVVEPLAVLVGITGQGKTRGMASTLEIAATINQHLVFVKPFHSGMDVRYLRRLFDCAYEYMRNESDGGGSTKGAITCNQIDNIRVPMPPREEQECIVRFIERKLAQISTQNGLIQTASSTLQEYRSALITNAITGKIDVRRFPIPATGQAATHA